MLSMRIVLSCVVLLAVASAASADLIIHDAFNEPTTTKENPPTHWVKDADQAHGFVQEGSLSYPGLADSTGNSFGLGDKTADYIRTFSMPELAVGETVYVSTLLRLNSPLDPFNAPNLRLYHSSDPHGSGVCLSWGTDDYTTNQMKFALNQRNRAYYQSESVKTVDTYDIADVTYLLVGAYTRGSTGSNGTVSMWVNPDAATFGADTAPAATLSVPSYQSDGIWDTLEYISNGSGSAPKNFQLDEIRIATDWAHAVPAVPEPTTMSMIALGGLAIVRKIRKRD